MMSNKKNRVVLITGSASGFGKELAKEFAKTGYDIVINGRDDKNKNRLGELKKTISKTENVNCSIVEADIREQRGLDLIKKALSEHGVNVFINNAAINPELVSGIDANDMGGISDIINTNTSSAVALCRSAFDYFSKNSGGIIININSMAGLKGSLKEPLYAASKFGMRGFSESVKDEWLKHGVRMYDVYSGAIATGMSSKRTDIDTLINPEELSKYIVNMCETKSFFAREINIQKAKPVDWRKNQ